MRAALQLIQDTDRMFVEGIGMQSEAMFEFLKPAGKRGNLKLTLQEWRSITSLFLNWAFVNLLFKSLVESLDGLPASV